MAYLFKPLVRYEVRELITELRNTEISIACLRYDYNQLIYYNASSIDYDVVQCVLMAHLEYRDVLKVELSKRGFSQSKSV